MEFEVPEFWSERDWSQKRNEDSTTLEKEKRKIQEASSYENKFIFLLKVFFHKKTRTDQVKYNYIFQETRKTDTFQGRS